MSLNKPRPDYPIYPSTGYYRERAKAFKRPKGRKGKKTKGKRVGNFVPFQDPNFLIFKAQDEARKARELAIAEAQQATEDREERQSIARQQLQLAQGTAQLQGAEALARQADAQARSDEARARDRRERMRDQRLIEDRREITGHLTRLYEASERRAGENLEVFRTAFQAIADRRPVDFREVREQEQTDLTADQRRDRRGSAEVDVEEVFSRAQRKQTSPELRGEGRFLRGGGTNKPKRFEGGATEAELAVAGGIEGQTPASRKIEQRYKQQPQTTARGGSGSTEIDRRGSNKGKQTIPQPEPEREEGTPVIGDGDWLKSVKLSPATLTESQVERQRPKLKPGEVKAGKAGGKAPVAKVVKPTDTSVFTSPRGRAFAEEVKKSEEALRKANQRGK